MMNSRTRFSLKSHLFLFLVQFATYLWIENICTNAKTEKNGKRKLRRLCVAMYVQMLLYHAMDMAAHVSGVKKHD